jgi:hypothetical protein
MAAQLYFTADAPDSRFFQSWDLDLVFDVLQVCYYVTCHVTCHIMPDVAVVFSNVRSPAAIKYQSPMQSEEPAIAKQEAEC